MVIDVDDRHAAGDHTFDFAGAIQRRTLKHDHRIPDRPEPFVCNLLDDPARIHEGVLVRHGAVIDHIGLAALLLGPVFVERQKTAERVAVGVLVRGDEYAFGITQCGGNTPRSRAIHLACVGG